MKMTLFVIGAVLLASFNGLMSTHFQGSELIGWYCWCLFSGGCYGWFAAGD